MGSSKHKTPKEPLSEAELKAIDVHKYLLSREKGYDVGMEFATADWLANHSDRWRRDRLKADIRDQLSEIHKHKWIESEKAGRDLGGQAIIDWIDRYASEWRQWKNRREE